MRKLRFIASLSVVAAVSFTAVAPAEARYFYSDLMIPDADVLWTPPTPAPVKKADPVVPAPAVKAAAAPKPVIPRLRDPEPAPKPVVSYTFPTFEPAPRAVPRSVPAYDPISDYIMLGAQRVVAPAPAVAPAPVAPVFTPPTPVVAPERNAAPAVVEQTPPPKNKPLTTNGDSAVALQTVQFVEGKNVFVQPTKAEDAMVKAIRESAAKGMTLIRIEGYADPQGTYTSNQLLSEKRADAVKDGLEVMLEERGFRCSGGSANTAARVCTDTNGGAAITLDPVGFSEKYQVSPVPAGCNASGDNRAKCEAAFAPNRRTEIKATLPVVTPVDTKVPVKTPDIPKDPVCVVNCSTVVPPEPPITYIPPVVKLDPVDLGAELEKAFGGCLFDCGTSIPDKTPETSPDKTPETSPDKTPETSPDKTPETSPDKTPETPPVVTPTAKPTVPRPS